MKIDIDPRLIVIEGRAGSNRSGFHLLEPDRYCLWIYIYVCVYVCTCVCVERERERERKKERKREKRRGKRNQTCVRRRGHGAVRAREFFSKKRKKSPPTGIHACPGTPEVLFFHI